MNIKLNAQEYHRNGVGGEPFYTVSFTLTEDGESTQLIAVLPSALRDYPINEGGIPCYIINPNNPLESKWRGDRLLMNLIEAGVWEWIDRENDRIFNDFLAKYVSTSK